MSFGPFTVVKPVETLSTVLFCAAATGSRFDKVEIRLFREPDPSGGPPPVAVLYELHDVAVTGVSTGKGVSVLLEEVTLVFESKVRQVLDPGTKDEKEFCWDVVKNVKC